MKDKELRKDFEKLEKELRDGWLIKVKKISFASGWGDAYHRIKYKDLVRKFEKLEKELKATQELLSISHIMPLMKHESLKKGNKEVEI